MVFLCVKFFAICWVFHTWRIFMSFAKLGSSQTFFEYFFSCPLFLLSFVFHKNACFFFIVLSHRPEALLLPFYVIFFLLFCSYVFQLTDSFLSPLHSAVELVHFSMLTFPPFKFFLIFHICVLRLSIMVVSSMFIISHWSILMMAVLDVR